MYVKHYPLNNYFILDFTVMQCSVNKIFYLIHLLTLFAGCFSLYCLVNFSSNNLRSGVLFSFSDCGREEGRNKERLIQLLYESSAVVEKQKIV